jgi:hypothetical protein
MRSGSVGAVWPPRYDRHNERIKGFCPHVISSGRDAARMLAAVRESECANPATRITIRAFVRQGLVEGLNGRDGLLLEARMDADNAVRGCELVYLARNSPERSPPREVMERELGFVRGVSSLSCEAPDDARGKVHRNGYTLAKLNGDGKLAVETLLSLYRETFSEYTFDITRDSVESMLGNGNIVMVGRDSRGGIVSSLVAEHCELPLENGQVVHLYELSDYATAREHRGKGLNTLMQIEAIGQIRSLYGSDALIYSESRAAWGPVNYSSRRAGLSYCGTLLQHCIIVSDREFGEQGRFENLHVWMHPEAH